MTNVIATSHLSVHLLLSALFLILHSASSQHSPSNASAGESPGYIVKAAPARLMKNSNASLDTLDHRVILHPGRWKIRTPERRGAYIAYHFSLGFNWTELEVDYPECSQVACRGLADSHQGCDHLCSTGTWHDATVALETATLEYNRAMASLDAAFNDLAALMDTHIINRHWSVSDSMSKLLSYHGKVSASDPQVVDVMLYHRTLIDEALKNIVEHLPSTLSYASLNAVSETVDNQLVLWSNNTSKFNELLDTWKSGAFKLAVQLNVVTFAFRGAHQRLLLCALGVQRSDMTGCEPDFITEFYIDTPVASHSLSSSKLVMVVKRETWNPVVLSHWYMPFIDSSGNRTCWLDRPMVSDGHANYRVPPCDSRGLCEPLELDDETVSACEVNENGEISLECPVVCGAPCFGPICYNPQSDTYTLRTASDATRATDATNDLSLVRVTKSPRILSKVYYLSEADIRTSLASIQDRSARSSELLQRVETVLQNIIAMDVTARKYIDKAHAETEASQSQGAKCVDCERTIGRSLFMAAASVTLSALTCPLLIVVIIKLWSTKNQNVPVRTNRISVDTFL